MERFEVNSIGHNKRISVFNANLVFLIGIILLTFTDIAGVFIDIGFGDKMFYHVALLTEILFVLTPAIIIIKISGSDINSILRLKSISISSVLIIIGIILFSMPIIGFINLIVIYLVGLIGTPLPNPTPEIGDIKSLVYGLLIIAGVTSVCEEIMFRGVVLRGYEHYGHKTAIVVSSLLFALMHRNIQTLMGIFFIGLIIGYTVYLTDSIFAGIVAHATNNAAAVIITFATAKLYESLGTLLEDISVNEVSEAFDVITFISWGILIIFSAVVLWGLFKLLKYQTGSFHKNTEVSSGKEDYKIRLRDYIPAIIGLGIISIIFAQQIYVITLLPQYISLLYKLFS